MAAATECNGMENAIVNDDNGGGGYERNWEPGKRFFSLGKRLRQAQKLEIFV